MTPFLRGRLVDLVATEAGVPMGHAAWLDAPQGGDAVVLQMRAPDGTLGGLVGLAGIDWITHRAHLCGGGPHVDEPVLADALGLVLRYAFDELNLDGIEALPRSGSMETLLTGLGFQRLGPPPLLALHRDPPPLAR